MNLNKYLQRVLTHPEVTGKAEYAGVLPLLFRLKHLLSVLCTVATADRSDGVCTAAEDAGP